MKDLLAIGFIILLFCAFWLWNISNNSSQPKVEIIETGLCLNEYDVVTVCGAIKNISDDVLDVKVYTNVYDNEGAQVQDQITYIDNLEPNTIAKIKGYTVPKEAHETKIVDIKYSLSN